MVVRAGGGRSLRAGPEDGDEIAAGAAVVVAVEEDAGRVGQTPRRRADGRDADRDPSGHGPGGRQRHGPLGRVIDNGTQGDPATLPTAVRDLLEAVIGGVLGALLVHRAAEAEGDARDGPPNDLLDRLRDDRAVEAGVA